MNKPKLTESEARAMIAGYNITDKVCLLGIRGYYKNTMGKPGVNDRGIYDDAAFIIAPNLFSPFNFNTDPSNYKNGIAVLKAGVWRYKPGKHKINSPHGYPAFVQAGPVTVIRDKKGPDTGWFGINIHRGGIGTGSLGCQTLPIDQWNEFHSTLMQQLELCKQKDFPYILTEL